MSRYASFLGIETPYVYQGSHVQPGEDDQRGGDVDLAYMPAYAVTPEAPVAFLRLSVREDPSTYHGSQPGYAAVVLDRSQVVEIRDALTAWLDREDWDE